MVLMRKNPHRLMAKLIFLLWFPIVSQGPWPCPCRSTRALRLWTTEASSAKPGADHNAFQWKVDHTVEWDFNGISMGFDGIQ